MGALKDSFLNGLVAFILATAATGMVGRKRGIWVGLLTGVAVALSTWVSSNRSSTETELEDETTIV